MYGKESTMATTIRANLSKQNPYGLLLDEETNTLSVDVANDAEKDNTRPISSAAVDTIVGNISVLLSGI